MLEDGYYETVREGKPQRRDFRISPRHVVKHEHWVNSDGVMTDFFIWVEVLETGQRLASADCRHGKAHLHDDRDGHGPAEKYPTIPLVDMYAVGEAYDQMLREIIAFCKRKGMLNF